MTAREILMAPIVEMMRWMTRHMGPIARPIIRWVANREVIACGLRDEDGSVRIIYSPQVGRIDHRVVRRGASGWVATTSTDAPDFTPDLVRQIIVPEAKVDDRYHILAQLSGGRIISSPLIQVKRETRCRATLTVEFDQKGGAAISWPKARNTMLYFLTIQQIGLPTLVGVYTRELCWTYPAVSTASLTIGGSAPPPLLPGSEYLIQLVAVDYHGWVGTWSTWKGTHPTPGTGLIV